MKSKIILSFLVLIFFNTGFLLSQTTLDFYNNTSRSMYVAFAYWDNANNCWTASGWYSIKPYKERSINLGRYSGKVYVHGHQSTFFTDSRWGRGYSFCIDPSNAFNIRNADKISCKHRASFSEKIVKNGRNVHNFNP